MLLFHICQECSGRGHFLNPLGYFGVAVFLFLSGYGLQKSYDKNRLQKFWEKRIRRIIPPLAIVTLMIVAVCKIMNKGEFKATDIVLSCLGLSNTVNPVTWYIGMMWYCYLLYYLCQMIGVGSELSICISIMALSILFGNTSINMWGLNAFNFSAGIFSAKHKLQINIIRKYYLLVSVMLFAMGFILYYFVAGNIDTLIIRNPSKSVIAFLFLNCFFSMINVCKRFTIRDRNLRKLGELSYEAFMIHAIFIWYFPQLFSDVPILIAVLIFSIPTWIISEIVHKLVGLNDKILDRRINL